MFPSTIRQTFHRTPRRLRLALSACLICGLALLVGARPKTGSDPVDRTIELGAAEPGSLYAVTIAVKDPAQRRARDSFQVSIADNSGTVAEKWLHAQDLDLYLTLRPRSPGTVTATIRSSQGELPEVTTDFQRISETHSTSAVIAAMPNDAWQTAQPLNSDKRFTEEQTSGPTPQLPSKTATPL